ncbi:MAG: hypothetical protein ACRDRJ_12720 [Streptosporangiaceae bacterium]
MTGTLRLFDDCALPGCRNLVDRPGQPCGECLAAFGGYLRDTGRDRPAAEVAAELAERDRAVAAVYAERRQMAPLPEPCPAEHETAWRRGQLCWCCEERRACRADPARPGRWICKSCAGIT